MHDVAGKEKRIERKRESIKGKRKKGRKR